METKMKGKAIIGAMAAIMLVSVFAAMVGSAGAYSEGGEYNIIEMNPFPQKVLIGQDLDFSEGWGTDIVTVSRVRGGVVEWSITADAVNQLKVSEEETQWTKDGAFFVNYLNPTTYDAQLSISEPIMPLELKVGTRKVSSIAVGTSVTIYTAGMNLFPEDRVDLVIIGPNGQIKCDEMNNQQFTNITVAQLISYYGDNNFETAGWSLGDYTFQVKTRSDMACGLEAASAIKELRIEIGKISIEAETTSTVELDTLKLTVTGVADDPIKVEASPLSRDVMFMGGIDDTPTGANYHGNWFADTIDADGIMKYAVEFHDTAIYTIKVTVTGGDREGDSDTVDITVYPPSVAFDLPPIVVIGDRITISGIATSGTYVSVFVDDILYSRLWNLAIEDAEFCQEVRITDVGMWRFGITELTAYIDCDMMAGEERPTRSPDGITNVLLLAPWLTASLSTDSVGLEDDFIVSGTAPGSTEVTLLYGPPRGGGGKSLLDKGQKGLSPRKASVSTWDDTFSKKMTVQEDATTGYYDIYVMCSGMDGVWGMTGQEDLEYALDEKYHIPSLTSGIINVKTQEEIKDILEDLVTTPGADDLMWKGKLEVETPFVKLDPIDTVCIGEPLVVKGTSNRPEGYVIIVTCQGPVELAPHIVKVKNDSFGCVFDTTGAKEGTYVVKADDGDGHLAVSSVNIIAETPAPP